MYLERIRISSRCIRSRVFLSWLIHVFALYYMCIPFLFFLRYNCLVIVHPCRVNAELGICVSQKIESIIMMYSTCILISGFDTCIRTYVSAYAKADTVSAHLCTAVHCIRCICLVFSDATAATVWYIDEPYEYMLNTLKYTLIHIVSWCITSALEIRFRRLWKTPRRHFDIF